MKRMYLQGLLVLGPSWPRRCRMRVASTVNSQSSMNSQRCDSPVSLLSELSSMMLMMQSTMARLYSKPPCSRRLSWTRKLLSLEMSCETWSLTGTRDSSQIQNLETSDLVLCTYSLFWENKRLGLNACWDLFSTNHIWFNRNILSIIFLPTFR